MTKYRKKPRMKQWLTSNWRKNPSAPEPIDAATARLVAEDRQHDLVRCGVCECCQAWLKYEALVPPSRDPAPLKGITSHDP